MTNNVIIAFELLLSMSRRNNGQKGFIVLKLDISKAYDWVKWYFVCKVMEGMGFLETWRCLVYDCLSTT